MAYDIKIKKINMSLNVHNVHFDADEKLVKLIEEKSKKLYNFNDTITSVDVYLKLENTSEFVKDKIVEIKINVLKDILFTKESSKTFEESFAMALDSSIKQLKKKKEILKG